MASKWTQVSVPVRLVGMESVSSELVIVLYTSKTFSSRLNPVPVETL